MRAAMGLAALAAVVAITAFTMAGDAAGPGGRPEDMGPNGHWRFTRALAEEAEVAVLHSSIALLPPEAGAGDTLFLFPSYRPGRDLESARLREFVREGGRLVVAADGAAAAAWLGPLDLPTPTSVPIARPPQATGDCIETALPGWSQPLCLPSPTALPEARRPGGFGVAAATFLDLDGDGALSTGDQGPLNITVAFSDAAGLQTVIADGDLWRNAVVEAHPANLDLARHLASGTVYIDATGGDGRPWSAAAAARLASAPGPGESLAIGLVTLAIALGIGRTRAALAWTGHVARPGVEDPALQSSILQAIDDARHRKDET